MGLGLGGICKPGGSSEAELVGSSVVLPQTPPPTADHSRHTAGAPGSVLRWTLSHLRACQG